MPSGPKKRKALRRRSLSRPGLPSDADNNSVSGSHASDEGTSPKTSDDVSQRLSLDTETHERSSDQTFQTEEWVRVSDFDIGTPTSTSADNKGDFDAATEDSYSEVRGQDKLADWETVSRGTAGNSSSAEDVGDTDHLAGDESSGCSHEQGQKLPHVNEGKSESSSDSDDDSEKSSSSKTSSSTSHASTEKLEKDEGLSSTVVAKSPPSQEDHDHYSSPEAVVLSESPEDQELASDEVDSVPELLESEEQAAGAVVGSLSAEHEDEGSESVPDISILKDDQDDQSRSVGVHDDSPSHDRVEKDETNLNGFATGNLEKQQVAEEVEQEPEEKEVEPQASKLTFLDPHVDTLLGEGHSEGDQEESQLCVEPTTPDKVEEKSRQDNLYNSVRSISEESISKLADVNSSEEKGVNEDITETVTDVPPSSGIPEPDQHGLDQLLEIGQSKEIANLGRQEEKLLAKEEEEIGTGITETQPLADVLAAVEVSRPVEEGELQNLQPVAVEEAPLVEDEQSSHDPNLQRELEGKDRLLELSTGGAGEQGFSAEAVTVEKEENNGQHVTFGDAKEDPSLSGDLSQTSPSTEVPIDNGEDTLVQLRIETGSELPNVSAESSKGADLSGKGVSIGGSGGTAGRLDHYSPSKKPEEHGRPRELWEGASELRGGCCEPVQWFFERMFGTRTIRN